jgi:hypothetical protein
MDAYDTVGLNHSSGSIGIALQLFIELYENLSDTLGHDAR